MLSGLPLAVEQSEMISRIYQEVVTRMPSGGLRLVFVLVALALIVSLWGLWSQRTLACNQIKIAQMLERHLAEHGKANDK